MKSDLPLVSIVMPTYNQAEYLLQAIESVLEQTYHNLELIIVNDGSTDDTSDILGRQEDDRVKILHQENQGASAAMNAGFRISKGRYLTWLASDNFYRPCFLEKMVAVLEASDHYALAYTSFENVDEGGRHIDYVLLEEYVDGLLLVNPGAIGVGFLYRRGVYDFCGDYEELVCNDLAYWLKASERFSFTFIPEVLVSNRKHDSMQTVRRREELIRQTEMLIEKAMRRQKKGIPFDQELLRFQRAVQRLIRGFRLYLPAPAKGTPIDVVGEGAICSLIADALNHAGFEAREVKLSDVLPGGRSHLLPVSPEIEKALESEMDRVVTLRNQDGRFGKWY